MQREVEDFCPLVKGKCLKWGCKFFTKLIGIHPQTGNPVDDWDCAISWLPILLTENSQQARSTAAAVESLRNEVVKGTRVRQEILLEAKEQNGSTERFCLPLGSQNER